MPDAIFAHPRLALVYDAFDGARDDLAAYLGIVRELRASRVVDIGCGTGSLAVLLAGNGCTVMGVDPAAASLEVAGSKDAGGEVTWACGGAASARGFDADLAVMTGNVAQVFTADDDWERALRAIRGALGPPRPGVRIHRRAHDLGPQDRCEVAATRQRAYKPVDVTRTW